jgi:rhodanese-related sulfurtransferase
MKTLFLKITLILTLSITFISCAQNKKEANTDTATTTMEAVQRKVITLITPEELSKVNNGIQLVDVRTPKEYAEGHIPNADNINFYDPNFAEQIGKLDKDKAIYIYCRSGGRSGRAAQQLKKMGFTKIYDLQGGIMNWNKNNFETVK